MPTEQPSTLVAPGPKKWTSDEDQKLRETVAALGDTNWLRIADNIPMRSNVQCLHRWQTVSNPGLQKGTWKPAEDDLLIFLVSKGFKDWGKLAKHMPGRTGKSCRERWSRCQNTGETQIEDSGKLSKDLRSMQVMDRDMRCTG